MSSARKKILFVAMQNSPHTVRWINQIAGGPWDIHLFPMNDIPVHPGLRNVTVHQPWFVLRRSMLPSLLKRPGLLFGKLGELVSETVPPGQRIEAIHRLPVMQRFNPFMDATRPVSLGESGMTAPAAYGPKMLSKLIKLLKPDLIHSLEFQHCGYNVLAARALSGKQAFPAWLATNWGSDIYHFRHLAGHRSTLTRLLEHADFYSCECHRDIELARELGFAGQVMPVIPNAGGFELQYVATRRQLRRPSQRKLILVKGYQSFAGRALTALDAVEQCESELQGTMIRVYSASLETKARVSELKASTRLDIDVLEHASHDAMLRLFGRARVYLGVSISDGISTSMLEAMAMGAFPVQTHTACCSEWFKDGESGYAIPPDGLPVIVDRLRRALTDDALVDRASDLNWETVQSRLDQDAIQRVAMGFYETIFAENPAP